ITVVLTGLGSFGVRIHEQAA
ncbi:hypothetical protein Ahia01_000475000, partial [Argonauta hians]